jgi:hypothetical protein
VTVAKGVISSIGSCSSVRVGEIIRDADASNDIIEVVPSKAEGRNASDACFIIVVFAAVFEITKELKI